MGGKKGNIKYIKTSYRGGKEIKINKMRRKMRKKSTSKKRIGQTSEGERNEDREE